MAEEKKSTPKQKDQTTNLPEAVSKILDSVKNLSVKDLSVLVKALEEEFGVSANQMVATSAPAGGDQASGEEKEEEKATYTVHLAQTGEQKIAVIKALREIRPDLGLKEAKDLSDTAPVDVAENMPKDEAKQAQEKLVKAGAKVELK